MATKCVSIKKSKLHRGKDRLNWKPFILCTTSDRVCHCTLMYVVMRASNPLPQMPYISASPFYKCDDVTTFWCSKWRWEIRLPKKHRQFLSLFHKFFGWPLSLLYDSLHFQPNQSHIWNEPKNFKLTDWPGDVSISYSIISRDYENWPKGQLNGSDLGLIFEGIQFLEAIFEITWFEVSGKLAPWWVVWWPNDSKEHEKWGSILQHHPSLSVCKGARTFIIWCIFENILYILIAFLFRTRSWAQLNSSLLGWLFSGYVV